MRAANKAIINVGILYGKAILTAGLVLLSTRWILQALGEEDYGVYNLVGGIIAMFSFLNVAMVAASQRFLSFAIGQNRNEVLNNTFKASVILHIVIGIIVLFLFEIMGRYLMCNHLSIPGNKLNDAIIVLHCLSITAFLTITTVPYQAILNSHENMLTISLINIYESVMNIGIAVILLKYYGNRLILYAVLVMVLTLSSMIITRYYCHRFYPEVRGNLLSFKDFHLLKKMFSFAGWNFIGSISSLLRNQGLAMLMNSFFGIIVNASYGIATQVNGQAQFFSRTIIRALQPQIVKSEGANDRARMIRISLTTCKIPFLILSLVIVPLFVEMDFVLSLWLTEIPKYTTVFCKIILLITLIGQLKMGLSIAIESVGNIKWYQIVCGGLHFIVLPVAWFCYKQGESAAYGLYFILIEETFVVFLTSFFAYHYATISLRQYYFTAFIPAVLGVLSSMSFCYVGLTWISNKWLHLLLFTVSYIGIMGFISYRFVLNNWERNIIIKFARGLINRVSNRKKYIN